MFCLRGYVDVLAVLIQFVLEKKRNTHYIYPGLFSCFTSSRNSMFLKNTLAIKINQYSKIAPLRMLTLHLLFCVVSSSALGCAGGPRAQDWRREPPAAELGTGTEMADLGKTVTCVSSVSLGLFQCVYPEKEALTGVTPLSTAVFLKPASQPCRGLITPALTSRSRTNSSNGLSR